MRVLVAGAGPSGLYTGWKLVQEGHDVAVLEREDVVGGLAASLERGGNFYSYGTHHLHNPAGDKLRPFANLMGSELLELDRKLSIKFRGEFYPYPLSTKDLIRGLPLTLLAGSSAGLLKVMAAKRFQKERPANAEEAIIGLYGKKLYEIMFRDYTTRFWGVSPAEISTTFVDQRMPGINAVEEIKKALRKVGLISRGSLGQTVTIGSGKMYTTVRGVGLVYERIADEIRQGGGEVHTSCELGAVHGTNNQIEAVTVRRPDGEEQLPCDLLVSTIPLNHLALRLEPRAPRPVVDAASRLGFRALVVVGLLVRPERRLDAMFTYFPDRSFHRLAELTSPPAAIVPEGCSMLLAEVTCEVDDRVWNDPSVLEERIVRDLLEEGLIREDGVLEIHYLKAPEAYPRYALGFEQELDTIDKHLKGFANLVSTGRQGAFQFTNMIQSMEMAWKDTSRVLETLRVPTSARSETR